MATPKKSSQAQQEPLRPDWGRTDGEIGVYIGEESKKTLDAYRIQPNSIDEHANAEQDTARGGYAHRQLFELAQNSADALAPNDPNVAPRGSIFIRLTKTHLYCADDGDPIDKNGVKALMFSHLSPKRGTSEIGRFGLGFKSVLGVTDKPEFFSRSGSFRFDGVKARELLRPIAPEADRYPVLRLPEAVVPGPEMEADPILSELMGWAVNIFRLPLKPEAHESLHKQIKDFPPEFLLFVEHVNILKLQKDDQDEGRTITLSRKDGSCTLNDGGTEANWMLVKTVHPLSSDAKSDSRSLDDADEVPISWAAPIDRLNDPGKFWAYFPTMTTSLLAGILNAPWKTNEDRQNLLSGVYNNELIDAAAKMVAEALPSLSTEDDPARHLDALPRRGEPGDSEHSERLRVQLVSILKDREVVPDQKGRLRVWRSVYYPPEELISGQEGSAALERWATYDEPPSNWVHHDVLIRTRISRIERMAGMSIARRSISQWLESLTENATSNESKVQASMAAIQTAALIPESIRESTELGSIVLTATATLQFVGVNPERIYLGDADPSGLGDMGTVHPKLQADDETLAALKKLGLINPSTDIVARNQFKSIASHVLWPRRSHLMGGLEQLKLKYLFSDFDSEQSERSEFWLRSRKVDPQEALEIIESYDALRNEIRVRTKARSWNSLSDTLLPGKIIPEDGSRDNEIAIDTEFHEEDLPLLELLGVKDVPTSGWELSFSHEEDFTECCRDEFTKRDLPTSPQKRLLNFVGPKTTSGPLGVLRHLSEEGKAPYTWELLSLPSTYEEWPMRHDTQGDKYPDLCCESPAIRELRQHGRIKTDRGIRPLSDGLGDPPKDPTVLEALRSHPQADLIREAFALEPEILDGQPVGEDDLDWAPVVEDDPRMEPVVEDDPPVEPVHKSNSKRRLPRRLSRTLKHAQGKSLSGIQQARALIATIVDGILSRRTPADVQAARDKVRACDTDGERILAAVGEANLKRGLAQGLIAMLESEQGKPLSGIQLAEAAIATFHTGALREYRKKLGHLDPPHQWAGGARAVEFVRSLGFADEWARERNLRRDPFDEVDAPYSLPPLHSYQRNVVGNVRKLLKSDDSSPKRRGMISMPTGSGKTRVAVQAVVEAIRDDEFEGPILWVADRDELCEQAVQAWRDVWRSEGVCEKQLRISRMWAGQPPPSLSGEVNVVVATIQTLAAKIPSKTDTYEFLEEFNLIVFDEAHRSVARSFTSVMTELGVTRWRREGEPFLIGLTATPYRGHSEEETKRLVNRYGSNRLDKGAFRSNDPEKVIQELQDKKILAQADHETIEGGSYYLFAKERRQAQEFPWLPQRVEDRIARDTDRTRRIIEAYEKHIATNIPHWPTLIFATSVEHSKIVAALLALKGVKARAVTGETDTATRRQVVEEFRAGKLQALVNYGVFREGFDAPRTRAIIVARPVYSPNLYFQMIGRGLRGVKNGGNDRCLILNVRDNIENYKKNLAFSELDWLWAKNQKGSRR